MHQLEPTVQSIDRSTGIPNLTHRPPICPEPQTKQQAAAPAPVPSPLSTSAAATAVMAAKAASMAIPTPTSAPTPVGNPFEEETDVFAQASPSSVLYPPSPARKPAVAYVPLRNHTSYAHTYISFKR